MLSLCTLFYLHSNVCLTFFFVFYFQSKNKNITVSDLGELIGEV